MDTSRSHTPLCVSVPRNSPETPLCPQGWGKAWHGPFCEVSLTVMMRPAHCIAHWPREESAAECGAALGVLVG